jgi:hypothetical protein
MKISLFILLFLPLVGEVIAQKKESHFNSSGVLSLGGRSTISLFNDLSSSSYGTGLGGQFRLQFAERINSDWFFDYLTSDIGNQISRMDYHIGWSVLVYPMHEVWLLKPYIIAGHCFDYTHMVENMNTSNYAERWSSAVQGGIGTHIRLTERLDCSLTGQYMMHLGNHLHPEFSGSQVLFHEEKGASLEGHLLTTLSINYKIGKLW